MVDNSERRENNEGAIQPTKNNQGWSMFLAVAC